MRIHNEKLFTIFFGTAQEKFIPSDYKSTTNVALLDKAPFLQLKQTGMLTSVTFLQQVHGIDGVIYEHSLNPYMSFTQNGDYIITQQVQCGIGVVTADCLPIIVYDAQRHVSAIVHAGWRGAVQGILSSVLEILQKKYSVNVRELSVYFGPSAKVCCYQVTYDFVQQFGGCPAVIQEKNGNYYFDLPRFNQELLVAKGVLPESIMYTYNECTICNETYCSYRRQPMQGYRQMTAVVLHAQ